MVCSIRNFFFCCTLKTGTLTVGTMGCIVNLLQIVFLSTTDTEYLDDYYFNQSPSISMRLVGCSVFVLANLLLIIGTYKKSNSLIFVWLFLYCFISILLTLLFLVSFWKYIRMISEEEHNVNHDYGIFTGIICVLCCLYWYCWTCVRSHYVEICIGQETVTVYVRVVT